jgi:archaeosine-15-forming tRNA-guanine transglycosylase
LSGANKILVHVLAVGRAVLSALEIRAFKTGVAVKVRHGVKNKNKD